MYLSVNGSVTCSDFLSDTYPDLRCLNGSYGMLPPVLADECDGLWSRTAPTTITIDLFAYVSVAWLNTGHAIFWATRSPYLNGVRTAPSPVTRQIVPAADEPAATPQEVELVEA